MTLQFDKYGEAIPYETPATGTKKVVVFDKPSKTETKTYTIGDMFITGADTQNETNKVHIYFLAQTNCGEVELINLRSGNWFRSGVIVSDIEGITQEEFKLIAGYLHDRLVKIKSIDFKINELEEH